MAFAEKQAKLLDLLGHCELLLADLSEYTSKGIGVSLPPSAYHIVNGSNPEKRSGQQFQVLNIALIKNRSESSSLNSWCSSLDASCVNSLLRNKISETLFHITRLRSRVLDKGCRILVTGDVNAGKSTFINALIGKELLPTDQQPCTTVFCELLRTTATESNAENIVHGIKNLEEYDPTNENTFKILRLEDIHDCVTNERSEFTWLKIYTKHELNFLSIESPDSLESSNKELLQLDVSLIDSPGLNHDSIQTMQLFAKQDDIDVILFIVNAFNHLTLSACEFLHAATKEKDYMFIIVNRFDDIKNRDKCKRIISQQVGQVLPRTFAAAHDLIHFVSSKQQCLVSSGAESSTDDLVDAFVHLRQSLSSFVLEKRAQSKLHPARTYILNLLNDLHFLSIFNQNTSKEQVACLSRDVDASQPLLDKLASCREEVILHLDEIVDNASSSILRSVENDLTDFVSSFEVNMIFFKWPGVLSVLTYIDTVLDHLNHLATVQIIENRENSSKKIIEAAEKMMLYTFSQLPELFPSPDYDQINTICRGPNSLLEIADTSSQHMPRICISRIRIFSIWDELKTVLTFAGSFSAVAALAVGYRQLLGDFSHITWYFAQNPYLSKKFLLFPASLILFSVSYSYLSDLQGILTRRICKCFREQLINGGWIDREASRIVSLSRSTLKKPLWDIQKRVIQQFAQRESAIALQRSTIQAMMCRIDYFANYQTRVYKLLLNVESLSIA